MNRLKQLSKNSHISLRQIAIKTNITYSTMSYLQSEKRPYRQVHIDVLTAFFNVTSDYLLGRSDYGIKVWSDNDEIILTESEYNKLKPFISETLVYNPDPLEIKVITQTEDSVIMPRYFIHRELKGNIDDYELTETLHCQLNALVSTLDAEDLKKTIKFIKDYIKN